MSRKNLCTALLTVSLLMLAACSGEKPTPTPRSVATVEPSTDPTPTPTPQVVVGDDSRVQLTVYLSSNGSQQTGTAQFTQMDGFIELRVNANNSVPVQQMSLRKGECPDFGEFERDLEPLIGGVSIQEIRGYSFDTLTRGGVMLIVSARSGTLRPIAACADLPTLNGSAVSG
jgi:hypothetical protein